MGKKSHIKTLLWRWYGHGSQSKMKDQLQKNGKDMHNAFKKNIILFHFCKGFSKPEVSFNKNKGVYFQGFIL